MSLLPFLVSSIEIRIVSPVLIVNLPPSCSVVLISAPLVSRAMPRSLPVFFSTSRTMFIRARCSSWSPCEKLKRNTFAPASANLVIVSISFEAGPKVLTILVFFILKKSPIIQNQKLLG